MTDTVNVLPHMFELRDAWRKQNFKYTKEQQEQYDMLVVARRERVKYFYDEGLVASPRKEKKTEDWTSWGAVHSPSLFCLWWIRIYK